jgi:outer membrane protein assembly factor BamA
MRALFTFCLATPFLLAQAPPAAPQQYPLDAVHVEGNERTPTDRILAASGLKLGEKVGTPEFDQARDRLLATGAFETVGYGYKPSSTRTGYDVTFHVAEVVLVYRYRFEDLPAPDDALRAALRKQETIFTDEIPASPEVLKRYTDAIRQFVGGKVDPQGEVNADSGELEIVFRPAGARRNIAEVRFTGTQVLNATVLTQTMFPVSTGTPYSEPVLRRMLDSTIRPLYEEKGRIRVAFPTVTAEKSKENDGAVITVAVVEGPTYTLKGVKVTGVPEKQLTEIEKSADWHKDEVVNFNNIEAGVERIRQRVRATGYLRVETKVDREIHDQDHTVNLVVNVQPGAQYVLGKLDIQGLDLISEPAVRKLWTIEAGKPYPDGYAQSFLEKVRAEDMFDNLGKTTAEAKVDDKTKTVDVTLHFSGAGPKPADKKK